MSNAPTLYVIDGSSYIFRAYYAIRPLSTSSGIPTNAVFGFTQMLLRLLKEENPDHVVMVFDSEKPSFRKEKYQAYKANREAPPEDLIPQFDYIKKVVRALNIPVLEKPGFEADDIIATVVKHHLPEKAHVTIVTGDKDLMQLVDDRVNLLDTMKGQRTDTQGVREKFGVAPKQVRDVLALTGDSSDNVPGVPGIGPKTASPLIAQYGSLEALYEHLGEIQGKKGESLREFRDQAFLSKWLVTLHEDVDVEESLEDFTRKSPDKEACRKIFEELEFTRLLEEFGGTREKLSRKGYRLVQDSQEWKTLLGRLQKSESFAFDTETTSLDVRQAQLVGISLALKAGVAFYLPLGHKTQEPQLDLAQVIKDLRPVMENPKIKKIAQNYKYDAGILKRYDIKIAGLACDTMLASYLLDPASSHKLDFLSLKFLGHKMISFGEVTQKNKSKDFSQVRLEDARDYSCEDADVTFQLGEILSKKLEAEKLKSLLEDLEQPLTEVLLKMEDWGIKVDVEFLKFLQKDFGERILKKEENIYQLAGETFNIQSPKQLSHILFKKLGLPSLKKTKTGHSTNVEVLTELSKNHGLPQEILDFRSLAKLKSTYVDALLSQCDPKTHRVHTSYNQTIAETGRLSSSDPNLQNIPIRTEDGAKIRKAFIADQGFFLLSGDYSQIELRVLAHLSEDPVLLEAFEKGDDVHRLSASGIFQVAENEVTPQMRATGKTVNFAVVYGQTPFGLSSQLGISQSEAKKYIDQYFWKYQGVKAYREKILAEARERGEVRTLFGRRRFVPDINSKNFGARSLAERIAFNTVIQGTAADLIKKAMIDIDQTMTALELSSRLLLQVHDELVFEVKKPEKLKMKDLIREHMEKVIPFKVPLKVEIGEGENWAQAH